MPLYEYVCECGQRFEVIAPVNQVRGDGTGGEVSSSEATCPKCSSQAQKILSLFSFMVGDNWHKSANIASDGEGFKSVQMSKDEYDKRIGGGSLNDYKDVVRRKQ